MWVALHNWAAHTPRIQKVGDGQNTKTIFENHIFHTGRSLDPALPLGWSPDMLGMLINGAAGPQELSRTDADVAEDVRIPRSDNP